MSSYKDKLHKEGGFTIIEVVLVLAIAGLIFLIVFLALPQLQRSRRDTQRRSDAGRVLAAAESYAQNNNGTYPNSQANVNALITTYLTANSSVFADPSSGNYTITRVTTAANPTTLGTMVFANGYDCNGSGNSRDIAVKVLLEEGIYCQDNK